MTLVYKCENCGVIMESSSECFVIGKKHWDQLDLCWDCFMLTLNLGDGRFFGWMGVKQYVMKALSKIRKLT